MRIAPGTQIQDFRASWTSAVKLANEQNKNIRASLLFHDLRRSAIRVMIQEAGISESQAMLISGHETRSMLERYNIVSLKNVQDAGAKLDEWSKKRNVAEARGGGKRKNGSKSQGNREESATKFAIGPSGTRRRQAPK